MVTIMVRRTSDSNSLGSRRCGKAAARGYAVAVLWLLLASASVTVVAPRSPPASGFQTGGQFASTVIGQANFTSQSVGRDPASLYRPFRSTFDSSGNLWVADENNRRVVEFKPPFVDGEPASIVIGQPSFTADITTPSRSNLLAPISVAFDRSGNLWVADFNSNRTLEFTPPFADGMEASLEIGQPAGVEEFTSNTASSAAGGLHSPVDLTFDASGNLWIADRQNNRVLEFRPPFADGEFASQVIGQPNMTSSAFSTTQSGLNGPEGVALDSSGNLWVVDQKNNRVLEFAASSLGGNGPAAVLEIGQPAGPNQFSTSASATSQSGLSAPVGIAFDSSGDLLVADRANNRVLGFKPPFKDGMNASFEIGQPAGPSQFTTSFTSLSQDGLSNPLGIAVDSTGNLWVSDQAHARVLEFSGTAAATSGTDAVVSNGAAAVDEAATGMTVRVNGVPQGPLVNFYTADLAAQPPNTGSSGLTNDSSFYHLKVSASSGVAVSICIATPRVTASTDLKYFVGAAWNELSGLNRTASASICGTLPSSALGSLQLLALGDAIPSPTSPPFLQAGAAIVAIAAALASVTYVALRRRRWRKEG